MCFYKYFYDICIHDNKKASQKMDQDRYNEDLFLISSYVVLDYDFE